MRKYSPVTDRRRLRFTPRPFPTLATVAAVPAFALLGRWQLDRADEKRALAAAFASAGPAVELPDDSGSLPRYQRVIARGRYDSRHQFLLDNRVHEGRAGVQVLTPLVLDGGGMVLVNRGWQPFGRTRQDLPEVAVPEGPRRIAGKIDELPRAGIKLAAAPSGGWPRLVNYPTTERSQTTVRRRPPRTHDPARCGRTRRLYPRLALHGTIARPQSRLCDPVVRIRRDRGRDLVRAQPATAGENAE